jgi:RimJ/RimL family protein N-acetyltransferase
MARTITRAARMKRRFMINSPSRDIIIRPLQIEDAALISALLKSQPPAYSRFFYAFSFEETDIARVLAERERDVYSGIFWLGELVGFFMLRGWDAGYEVPAFGVLIDEQQRGRGFMQLALDLGKLISRLCGAPRLMAKIHPDNISAKGARRLGLVQTGVEAESGNLIYHLEL